MQKYLTDRSLNPGAIFFFFFFTLQKQSETKIDREILLNIIWIYSGTDNETVDKEPDKLNKWFQKEW